MKKFRFYIETPFVNCSREVVEDFNDEVTQKELENYMEALVWEFVQCSYEEIQE